LGDSFWLQIGSKFYFGSLKNEIHSTFLNNREKQKNVRRKSTIYFVIFNISKKNRNFNLDEVIYLNDE